MKGEGRGARVRVLGGNRRGVRDGGEEGQDPWRERTVRMDSQSSET